MSRRGRTRDPFERSIESALRPGEFISYRKSFSFMKALDQLVQQIDPLIDDDPARATRVFETFLAGCYAKTHELDDSSGELGNFMQELCCRWVTSAAIRPLPGQRYRRNARSLDRCRQLWLHVPDRARHRRSARRGRTEGFRSNRANPLRASHARGGAQKR